MENNFTFYNNNVSIKIKRVYDKIYRLSRHYLDRLLENSLCIKYSSLLLSIIIMKKSIEYILLQEKYNNNNNDIDNITKEKFIIKNNNYFNRIIKGYYELDYENKPEYQKLINEYDIIELFNQNKKENEFGNNQNSIKQSKTLTSFNKNKLRKYNNYYKNNIINNQHINALNIKVNEINFSSTIKPNINKLNNNNINNNLTNFKI